MIVPQPQAFMAPRATCSTQQISACQTGYIRQTGYTCQTGYRDSGHVVIVKGPIVTKLVEFATGLKGIAGVALI